MKRILILVTLLYCSKSFAQKSDPIVTDRPTQSAASSVVAKGNALIEYGFVYEKVATGIENITYANLLGRVGVYDGIEVRITQNYQQSSFGDENEVSGFSPLTIGTKVHLVEEENWVPQMSVLGQITLNTGKDEFKPGQVLPEVRLNFSNTLTEYLSVGYNIGAGFPENDNYYLYSAVLGYSFYPDWTVFLEPYGFLIDGTFDHRFNAGLILLASDQFQLDVSGGIGLSDNSPDSFVGFGASFGF